MLVNRWFIYRFSVEWTTMEFYAERPAVYSTFTQGQMGSGYRLGGYPSLTHPNFISECTFAGQIGNPNATGWFFERRLLGDRFNIETTDQELCGIGGGTVNVVPTHNNYSDIFTGFEYDIYVTGYCGYCPNYINVVDWPLTGVRSGQVIVDRFVDGRRDVEYCRETKTAFIYDAPSPNLVAEIVAYPSCGQANGVVRLHKNVPGNYRYLASLSLRPLLSLPDSMVYNVGVGSHYFRVERIPANNTLSFCTGTENLYMPDGGNPTIELVSSQGPSSCADIDGRFTVRTTNPLQRNLEYSINGGQTFTRANAPSPLQT
ncbi:MAG: hypothetical protein HC821_02205 [Lewinella sp.]|nr:hypothetical protein [Lewinella sp.]